MRPGKNPPTSHPDRATAGGAGSPAGAPALRSCCLADVTPEPVTFLWPPYVPLCKLTLLEGDPGQGKSWLTMAVAASGSLGAGLPGMPAFAAFRSLIFTAEDGLADTLRPRLDTFTADPHLVYAHDRTVHLDTAEGLAELEREIVGRQPRLVIIDPIMAYVRSQTDVYRANEVRAVLASLAKLASQHGCAILAVRHINKAKGNRAIYAGQGSIDFTAAARSVLLAARPSAIPPSTPSCTSSPTSPPPAPASATASKRAAFSGPAKRTSPPVTSSHRTQRAKISPCRTKPSSSCRTALPTARAPRRRSSPRPGGPASPSAPCGAPRPEAGWHQQELFQEVKPGGSGA